jgi:cephalosporin hydroxylase
MDPGKAFELEVSENISHLGADKKIATRSLDWMCETLQFKYTYNFQWMGRPIIQFPQDIVAMQEVIWQVNPDLIIETGIAHGGSLIFSASMLALREYSDAVSLEGKMLDPKHPHSRVLGIDIDIRDHNRRAIEEHPMANRIDMIQGSSTDPSVISKVRNIAKKHSRILVCLDSNHAHDHVLAELEAYAPLTSIGSYCVVFDTVIDDIPQPYLSDRPWGKGNSPKTAVREYLRILKEEGRNASDGQPLTFNTDKSIENKLLITVAPEGYLKRVKKPL